MSANETKLTNDDYVFLLEHIQYPNDKNDEQRFYEVRNKLKKLINNEEKIMLPDNRLDFISNIEQDKIDIMSVIRQQFIMLDDALRTISKYDGADRDGVLRCLSLARTNIETALQQTIKALCLIGEIKEEEGV